MPLHENSMACSQGFDYAALDGEPAPQGSSHDDVLEFARRLVSFIRAKPRARLTVDCLYLALGDAALEGETMTDIGRKHGLTKAAISKRTKEIREQLHLSPNANNKSAHACRRYSKTNRSPLNLEKPPQRMLRVS